MSCIKSGKPPLKNFALFVAEHCLNFCSGQFAVLTFILLTCILGRTYVVEVRLYQCITQHSSQPILSTQELDPCIDFVFQSTT